MSDKTCTPDEVELIGCYAGAMEEQAGENYATAKADAERGIAKIKSDAAQAQADVSRSSRSFWARVDDSQERGCWNWTGAEGGTRVTYGYFGGTTAHRFSYILHFGPIAGDLVVRHKCDNPRCVSPSHLELGTQQQNVDDMVERRRGWFQRGTCKNGHVRADVGAYINPQGKKECLACREEWWAAKRGDSSYREPCDVCGKEVRRNNLARHKKIHDRIESGANNQEDRNAHVHR